MKNRELKFRAWSEQRKSFVANCYPIGSAENYGFDLCGIGEDGGNELEDDDLVLMQFTGLKDKNGKDIYEGDITTSISEKEVWMVEMIKGCWCVIGDFPNPTFKDENGVPLYYWNKGIEVIGNIYENKNLIEQ